MDTKKLRYLQMPGTGITCKFRQLNPMPNQESSNTPCQGKPRFFIPWLEKATFKTPFFPPLFRSVRSNALQGNDAKDNPTRTFCTIYIKRDVSTSDAKLRLHYWFQSTERLCENEWTKGFFGKADKTINKLAFRMNVFDPGEPIRA